MAFQVKRVYETPHAGDGRRVLVDRLWPRGLTKASAQVDDWLRAIAPSNELRKWFGHDPAKWDVFLKRYFQELAAKTGELETLAGWARDQPVTLLFATKETRFNNAVALKTYLDRQP